MKTERLELYPERNVTMTTYLRDQSPEFPSWEKRPAIVILPGGAYQHLSDREAEPVALAFMAQSYQAFVVRYSIQEYAEYPNPLIDVSRAISMIRSRAEEWHVDPDQIAVIGFSAGGHLAGMLGGQWNRNEIRERSGSTAYSNQPNALILGYPVTDSRHFENPSSGPAVYLIGEKEPDDVLPYLGCDSHIGQHTPPTFLFHTYEDPVVDVSNTLLYAQSMVRNKRPCEVHLFQKGTHGLSLGVPETAKGMEELCEKDYSLWFDLCIRWLRLQFGTPVLS